MLLCLSDFYCIVQCFSDLVSLLRKILCYIVFVTLFRHFVSVLFESICCFSFDIFTTLYSSYTYWLFIVLMFITVLKHFPFFVRLFRFNLCVCVSVCVCVNSMFVFEPWKKSFVRSSFDRASEIKLQLFGRTNFALLSLNISMHAYHNSLWWLLRISKSSFEYFCSFQCQILLLFFMLQISLVWKYQKHMKLALNKLCRCNTCFFNVILIKLNKNKCFILHLNGNLVFFYVRKCRLCFL